MGRHKTTTTKDLIAVRLDPKVIAELDRLREHFSSTWFEASRSDVVRALLTFALQEVAEDSAAVMAKMGMRPVDTVGSKAKGRGRSG